MIVGINLKFDNKFMAKSKDRAKKKHVPGKNDELIVIDEKAGLIFY